MPNSVSAVFSQLPCLVFLSAGDFGFADFDSNNFLAVKITGLPSSGTLYWYNGSSGGSVATNQFISLSDIAAKR
jgi:hypothetical protein